MKNLAAVLVCILTLNLTLATKVKVKVRTFGLHNPRTTHHEVSANMDLGNESLVLLQDEFCNEKSYENLKNIVQHNLNLKPSSMSSSQYSFLSVKHTPSLLGREQMAHLSSIKASSVVAKTGVKITFEAGNSPEVDGFSNWIVNLSDRNGDLLKAKFISESMGTLKFIISDSFGKVNNLPENAKIYVGGPKLQDCRPEFLDWNPFIIKTRNAEDGSVTITGSMKKREKYWIKGVGNGSVVCEGKLIERENGAGEFIIKESNETKRKSLYDQIMQIVGDGEFLKYRSNLCLTTAVENAMLPDRKILGISSLTSTGLTGKIVINFEWLESQHGESFMHAVRFGDDQLTAALYLNKTDSGGTLVLHAPHETLWLDDGIKLMRSVYDDLLAKRDGHQLEASGPCLMVHDAFRGRASPLKLTLTRKMVLRGAYLEIEFADYE